jgi:hypothetical protein
MTSVFQRGAGEAPAEPDPLMEALDMPDDDDGTVRRLVRHRWLQLVIVGVLAEAVGTISLTDGPDRLATRGRPCPNSTWSVRLTYP